MTVRIPLRAGLASVALLAAMPQAAHAQQTMPAPTPTADALATQMRVLAGDPRNVTALIAAGELSTRLDDLPAAMAFFARAQAVDPSNPRIAAGRAGALTAQGRPGEALRLYQTAERAGVAMEPYLAQRGLAYDLIGQPLYAQRDYRAALRREDDDEVTRRLALSLGISGDRDDAVRLLDPLLRRNDRAAWRAQAFVLAMTGDQAGAQRIASSMMVGGAALTPFFSRMAALPAADRAFAVHFGEFGTTIARVNDARLAPVLVALAPEPRPSARPVETAAITPRAAERRGAARPVETAAVDRADRRNRRSRRSERGPIAAVSATSRIPVPAQLAERTPALLASQPTPSPITAGSRTPIPTQLAERMPTPQAGQQLAARSPVPTQLAERTPVPSPTPSATVTILQSSVAPTGVSTALPIGGSPTLPPTAHPPVALASSTVGTTTAGPTMTGQATPLVTAATDAVRQPDASAPSILTAMTPQPTTAAPIAMAASDPAPGFSISASSPSTTPAPVTRASVPVEIVSLPARTRAAAPAAPPPPPRPAVRTPEVARRNTQMLASIIETIDVPASELDVAPPPPPPRRAAVPARIKPTEPAAAAATKTADAATDPKKATTKKSDAKTLAAQKAEAKKAEPKAPDPKKAEPERWWVQVAGGANADDLDKDWKRLAGKSPAAFRGRSAYTTPLRATNRLLTGPFASQSEAMSFVNRLAKDGTSAFAWQSPAGQKIARLSTK